MAKPPKKQRLSVYLEPDVMKALAAHAARCEAALLRWCRHAERPIRLLVSDFESGKGASEAVMVRRRRCSCRGRMNWHDEFPELY